MKYIQTFEKYLERKECLNCGENFLPMKKDAKFCCGKCEKEWYRVSEEEKEIKRINRK